MTNTTQKETQQTLEKKLENAQFVNRMLKKSLC